MISVRTFSTRETKEYQTTKYQEFLNYFFNTDLRVSDIWKRIKVGERTSTGRFIRNSMKKDGLDSHTRWEIISRGEWLPNE